MSLKKAGARIMLILSCLIIISACGFHLRNASPQLNNIEDIDINASGRYQEFANVLKKTFRKTDIISNSASPYHLIIEQESISQRIATVSEKMLPSEYEVALTLVYSFTMDSGEKSGKPASQSLIKSQRIQLSRNYVYDVARITAMQREEQLLLDEMRQEAAYRILHQLQAVSDKATLHSTQHSRPSSVRLSEQKDHETTP